MDRPDWLERIATAPGYSVSNTRVPGSPFAKGAVLVAAADILLTLADCEEPIETSAGGACCMLCRAVADYGEGLMHTDACPWKLAWEWRDQYAREELS